MNARLSLTVALLAVMSAGVSSQVAGQTNPTTTVGVGLKDGRALITGTVVGKDNLPWANAAVRLRDLAANQIEQVATANHLGEFSFVVRPDVPYVVELVDRAGRVLAVSDLVTTRANEVATAMIALPSRAPSTGALFGPTASSILLAVATTGITLAQPDPPLSPEK